MKHKLIKHFPALSKSQQPKHPELRGLLIPSYWSYAIIDMNILYNHPNFIHAKTQIGLKAANIMKKLLIHNPKILKNISKISSVNNYKESYLSNSARQGLHVARSASLLSNKGGYHLTDLGLNLIKFNHGYINQYNKIQNIKNHPKSSDKSTNNKPSLHDQVLKDLKQRKSINDTLGQFEKANIISGKKAIPKPHLHKDNHSNGNKKPNYSKEHYYHTKLGAIGEQKVIDHENKRLHIKNSKPAIYIDHESNHNDRAGYDIKLINKRNDHVLSYIEVKTTSSTSNKKPFHMSQNEWDFASNNSSKYVLYLLYKYVDPKSSKISFKECTYNFNELKKLFKEPVSYKIYPDYLNK